MRKIAFMWAAFVLCELGVSPALQAEQPVHKPWFSHAHAKPAEKTPYTVRHSELYHPAIATAKTSHTPYAALPSKTGATTTGQKVVNQAMKYKGTKYVFGGTNKKGIDCSGLVMRVYHDVKSWQLPRTSADMYKKGQPIKESELRPGDLVFFKNTYKHGISHVGIYTGDNKFIHARNRRFGVTISKLSDPYFQLHYAGARRMI